ncbi:MAG: hypothetical protein SFU91_01130 [Chloroherpetonaceae bacterium]|nr:hypothetical protein [Chloroherpetonaceae bacterium]
MNRNFFKHSITVAVIISVLFIFGGCKSNDEEILILKNDKARLEQQVSLQINSIDSLKKMNSTLLGGAANKVSELIENNTNLESIIQLRQKTIDSLSGKLATTYGELRSTTETLQKEKLETAKKDSINSRLERSLGQRESEASTLKQQNETLQNANKEMSERIGRLSTQVTEIRQRTEGISTDINQSRTNISSFREEVGKQLNAIQEKLDRQRAPKSQPAEVESKPQ